MNANILNLLNNPSMEPADKARAAGDALISILAGISAMGDWMTQDVHPVGLREDTLSDTGYLLTFLADLALRLSDIKSQGLEAMAENTTSNAGDDEYVDIPVFRKAPAAEARA